MIVVFLRLKYNYRAIKVVKLCGFWKIQLLLSYTRLLIMFDNNSKIKITHISYMQIYSIMTVSKLG